MVFSELPNKGAYSISVSVYVYGHKTVAIYQSKDELSNCKYALNKTGFLTFRYETPNRRYLRFFAKNKAAFQKFKKILVTLNWTATSTQLMDELFWVATQS